MEPTKGGSIIFMKVKKLKITVVPALILVAVLLFGVILFVEKPDLAPIPEREQVVAEGGGGGSFMPQSSTTKLAAFASQNGLTTDDWPEALKELMRKEPAAEAFVMSYPFMKDAEQLLHNEWQYVMKMDRDGLMDYIFRRIEGNK